MPAAACAGVRRRCHVITIAKIWVISGYNTVRISLAYRDWFHMLRIPCIFNVLLLHSFSPLCQLWSILCNYLPMKIWFDQGRDVNYTQREIHIHTIYRARGKSQMFYRFSSAQFMYKYGKNFVYCSFEQSFWRPWTW